ncbi:hypothetical protein BDN71DRAFT_1454556, partial [Pleurotus eryngii]
MSPTASVTSPPHCPNDTKPIGYRSKSTLGSSILSATSCLRTSLDFGRIRHAYHGYTSSVLARGPRLTSSSTSPPL